MIPTPVIAEVYRGGRDHAAIDRVLNAVDGAIPTSDRIAKGAGLPQATAGLSDPVDAIVVAEALDALPAMILTSDPGDVMRLLETRPERRRVLVVRV